MGTTVEASVTSGRSVVMSDCLPAGEFCPDAGNTHTVRTTITNNNGTFLSVCLSPVTPGHAFEDRSSPATMSAIRRRTATESLVLVGSEPCGFLKVMQGLPHFF